MKKNYFLVLATFLGSAAFAQLTQSTHAPVAGDSYQMYQCDSTNINPGASGSGVTWTFAMATHSSVIHNYAATASTNPSYPMASVLLSAPANNTSYFSSSANSLLFYGGNITVGSQAAATLNYTAPAIYAAYPMSLNTTSSTVTSGSINITVPITASGTFNGNSNTLAGGTGTLVLPGNTYNNVIRVVNTQTVNFTTMLIGGTITQKTFEFYENGTKAPVFVIATATIVAGGTSTQTLVTRMVPGTTVGMENNLTMDAPMLFPNPVKNILNVISPNAKRLVIIDVMGKEIANAEFTNSRASTDLSSQSKGIYVYRIIGANDTSISTGKIIVE